MSIDHGLAGDINEGRRIGRLREILEDVSDEIKVYRERILTWEVNHSLVTINGERVEHQALPYSPTSYIRGHVVENPEDCRKDTVLVNRGNSRFDVYYDIILAKRFGCEALLLTQVETVSISPPYLQSGASEPPLGLISIKGANPKKGNLVEINLETKARIVDAYAIHAIKNGRERSKKLLLVSNHDTWLSKSKSWVVSAKIFRELNDPSNQWEYLCISGMESGAPGFSSLYWGYMARQLSKKFTDRDLAIEVRDNLALELSPGMRYQDMKGDLISPMSASFELLRNGIPSVTLGIGDTSTDQTDVIKTLKALSSNFKFSLEDLINDLLDEYSLLPPEVKSLLTNLSGKPREAKYLVRYLGRYMGLPGRIEYALFHKLVAVRKSFKHRFMFAEDNPALGIEVTRNGFLASYRSGLDREITNSYIYRLHEDLQELL
ncbi:MULTISPECIES: aminopeptidase [Metallosphaera]|uniref:Aminopeptidase Iap family-like protein n=3 Tax=Metallosphaera TaxID=41980 RepID=A4YCW1_METS5|nr:MULTISPECIES: aminopeptidase [Metallosphaera]ABP94263.1 aminopeptidase Iap family-like protein [Metallosphaera sedula DSM 5348]AIM26250.1 aminopeptidase Iap family-like protein [Metallosphaera sedula]AKV73267.1 hypothetical protein MsedA_0091 [Metallosphaera sedula]AKV75511.1 hypothetical protein MsedB_0091 [Metallosphaera sedula]AKV77757.1 hypothetical protein MsedC_0090 [Metallosphaera sedula]